MLTGNVPDLCPPSPLHFVPIFFSPRFIPQLSTKYVLAGQIRRRTRSPGVEKPTFKCFICSRAWGPQPPRLSAAPSPSLRGDLQGEETPINGARKDPPVSRPEDLLTSVPGKGILNLKEISCRCINNSPIR